MKTCQNCNKQLEDEITLCPECGSENILETFPEDVCDAMNREANAEETNKECKKEKKKKDKKIEEKQKVFLETQNK